MASIRTVSESEWLDIFSDNLSSLIEKKRITQKELAHVSYLTEATISNLVNGRGMPNIRTITKLSYALNCPVDMLVDFGVRIQ